MNLRFGPAGLGPVKTALNVLDEYCKKGIKACEIAKAAHAAFVKTSTGFAKSGATVEDVALMRQIVGQKMGVKASGGIRTKQDAIAMLNAGADRLGCSNSVAIVEGGN